MRSPMLQAGGCPIEKQSARENPLARKHHTWKNSLWSAVGKKSVTPPRRAKPYIPEPILRIKPLKCWSWRRDLNPRPSDYKSDALPTELRQQLGDRNASRAHISLWSLPDVRDNSKRYHNGNPG